MKQQQDERGRQGRQRYFADDRRDETGRRYQSGGYQEETGDFGDQDDIQGPDRQHRDWQAEQFADERGGDLRRGGGRAGGGRERWNEGSRWNQGYRPAGESRSGNIGQEYGDSRDTGPYGQGRFWRSATEEWGGQDTGSDPQLFGTRQGWSGQESGRQQGFGGQSGFQRTATSFRGRGPKDYQRSDERLREMICEKLTDDERIDASEVSVQVKNGEVKLTGTVPDRQTKYQLEELVERCGGVKDIDNQLRVSRGSGEAGQQQAGATGEQQRGGRKSGQGPTPGGSTGGAGL